MKNSAIVLGASVLSAFVIAACGSATSSSTSDTGDDTTTTTTSDISSAVPSDIVVSSPTAEASAATLNLASKSLKGLTKAVGDAEGSDYLAKKEALQALVAGEGECSFTLALPDITSPDCYGPVVDYEGHVDAGGEQNQPNGQLPVGDVGIWNATEGEEACAAAKMNELVDKIAAYIDNAIKTVGGAACAGKKAGLELPEVADDPVDLKEAMDANVTATGLTVEAAQIDRLEDDSDGNPVYQGDFDGTMTLGSDDKSTEILLTHVPTADDNSTYKGKIQVKMSSSESQFGMNCDTINTQAGQAGTVVAGVILYEKASDTAVTYEFNFAQFCGSDTDPFDADGNIDPTDVAQQGQQEGPQEPPPDGPVPDVAPTNPTGWADNWNYGVFSFDPTTGAGSYAYAWHAGTADQRTRTLNLTTEADAEGNVTGTAFYGYGPDIATATAVTKGTIDGFVCNWAGPNGAISDADRSAEGMGEELALAQKQTMSRAAGETLFSSDVVNIVYAPTNSCDLEAGNAGFTYEASIPGGGAANFDLDRATGSAEALTNELIPLADVDFVKPTPPSDI